MVGIHALLVNGINMNCMRRVVCIVMLLWGMSMCAIRGMRVTGHHALYILHYPNSKKIVSHSPQVVHVNVLGDIWRGNEMTPMRQDKYTTIKLSNGIRVNIPSNIMRIHAGYHIGSAPLGYSFDNHHVLIPNNDSHIIRSVFALHALNCDIKTLAMLYHLTEDRVVYILNNPIYQGHIRYKGGVYPGIHTPLIQSTGNELWQDHMQPSILFVFGGGGCVYPD